MGLELLYEIHARLLRHTPTGFKRSLYHRINWEGRLTEITGARGVGKTTLMLQYIKSHYKPDDTSVLYFSADDPYFYTNSIIDTVDMFVKYGGRHVFIDEVHKYLPKFENTDWSGEMKAIYDRYPQLKVIYSGSSIIQLKKGAGDLSRRANPYFLPGMSFREYLKFNKILDYEPVDLETLLKNHANIAKEITSRTVILPHFREYLKFGFFPFYNLDKESYPEILKNIINVVLETDIPSVANLPYVNVGKIKKLLAVLTTSAPYTPNLSALGNKIGIHDQRTLLRYFNFLEKAVLIRNLRRESKGNAILRKPDKVYISNTNFIYALEPGNIDKGTVREVFFYSQAAYRHKVRLPEKGDFKLNDKYIFEIGGRNKDDKQIKNTTNSYLVIDDIEHGIFNRIPLWLFGFLY